MLKKFSVKNFKNFSSKIVFDLSAPCNYEFNSEVVTDGCLTKALIYGPNGSGKSNLGLALFDIVSHLTDKEKLAHRYSNYVNLNSRERFASFEYVFSFNGKEVVYQYNKSSLQDLLEEHLYIDSNEVICYDFMKNEGFTCLNGTETLNIIANSSQISRVKFVRNNAILVEDDITTAFNEFVNFVDHMLLFYSLDKRGYQGFTVGQESIAGGIINSGHLSDFESFLRDQGLNYKLYVKEIDNTKAIYCKFKQQDANFWSIASTGTISLTLFYFWYIRMKTASLVFIDEFDAFYHFELAHSLVSRLRSLGGGTQVVLTSHNTDLMTNDLLRPDCYFLIGDTKIASLANLTEKELRKAHNLQKMYKAGAFNG